MFSAIASVEMTSPEGNLAVTEGQR
jgi:hypothetical protein